MWTELGATRGLSLPARDILFLAAAMFLPVGAAFCVLVAFFVLLVEELS